MHGDAASSLASQQELSAESQKAGTESTES